MNKPAPIRAAATAVLASLSLLLTGCFIAPGKFESELVLMEENKFTFTYDGEIFFLGLSSLAQMGEQLEAAESDSEAVLDVTCFDEETYEERECTPEELEEQQGGTSDGPSPEQAQQLSAMLGGIDPTDPEAAEELASKLLRQQGWNKVESLGDGVFDVSYSVSGTLGHDFIFPLIEGVPTTNPFVQFFMRDGNIIRVNAPGFAPQDDSSGMNGMTGSMGAMAGFAALAEEEDGEENAFKGIPTIDGTFRIVTSGQILANNTDAGPNPTPNGQLLSWDISPRTSNAPTALIDLSR